MKPRSVLLVGAAGVSAYTLLVVGVYAWHVRSLPVSSDAGSWGQLGDYVGGLLNPLFALLNVALIAYIALSVQRHTEMERKANEESEERVRTVLDLHREWTSESLFRSRTLAGSLARSHSSATLSDIEQSEPYESVAHMWIVVSFFQRLAFMIQHKKVHTEMTVELFGELFLSWWLLSFERQVVPCDWDASTRITWLRNWLFENTTESQRAPWVRRAEQELLRNSESRAGPQSFEPETFED